MKALLTFGLIYLTGFSAVADEIKAWVPTSNNLTLSEYFSNRDKPRGIYIIEYEGVKYIVNAAGGIVRHEPKVNQENK